MKIFRTIITMSAALLLVTISCNQKKPAWPIVLDHVVEEITAAFHEMDSVAAVISGKIAENPEDTALIEVILQQDLGRIEGVTEQCYITADGILKIIAPHDYYKVEGTDISYQDHIIRVRETKKPVLSGAFRAVEGFQSIALAYPILSPSDELLGITVLLIQPDILLRGIITRKLSGIPADVWVMQKDGVILYDFDQEEIGRNLFTDPLYKDYTASLQTAARFAEEVSGVAVYDFLAHGLETPVTNQAFWTTVGLYGTEWKIVLTNPIGDLEFHRTSATLGLKSAPQRLYELCNNKAFQEVLAAGDRTEIERYFKEFYDMYPIYTIEWVDSTVTTRFGHPAQYSLENHQTTPNNVEQKAFYDAVVNREETTVELRLLEGNTGTFRLCPVNYRNKNLGSIYYLIINR